MSFVTFMEDLREHVNEAGEKMTNSHFITQTKNCLTAAYDNEVRMIEREIDLGQKVDINDLKDRLALVHERSQARGYKEEDDADEDGRRHDEDEQRKARQLSVLGVGEAHTANLGACVDGFASYEVWRTRSDLFGQRD